MNSIHRAIMFAKLFDEGLTVNFSDYDNKYYVTVRWVHIKEGSFLSTFQGRGDTVESACSNLLTKIGGLYVKDAPDETRKEIRVVAI